MQCQHDPPPSGRCGTPTDASSFPGWHSRRSWRVVLSVLLLFALGFALFYPEVAVNVDEATYIRQARLISSGDLSQAKFNPLTGQSTRVVIARYPLGTALSMAPLVELFGWRSAFVVPFVSVLCGVLLTAVWLHQERRSPIFALLVLGFPATLVLSRVAMSDAPSLAVVTLGLWLFWRGQDRGPGWWLAAGFVAGASILWRESNALPFVAFFAGAVLRRERKAWALVAGGFAGVGLRLLAAYQFYGDPFFFREVSANFARHGMAETLLLQLVGLLILVPGGLFFAFAYRGRRWPELLASVGGFWLFYLYFGYAAIETGPAKRIVLGLRFFLPLLPLLAFAAAESAPRLWRRLLEAAPPRQRAWLRPAAGAALWLWILGVATAAVGVHWSQHRWTHTQARIGDAIRSHVNSEAPIVTNAHATGKFIEWLDRRYLPLTLRYAEPFEGRWLARHHGHFFVVILDRSDSDFWREDARKNADFLTRLKPKPTLVFDEEFSASDRLRIWRVDDPASQPSPGAPRPTGDRKDLPRSRHVR